MSEKELCFAGIYIVEAFIVISYYEYVFQRKSSNLALFASFIIGYTFCFFIYWINCPLANLISIFSVNLVLSLFNYRLGAKTAIAQSAFLCFIMALTEVLSAMFLSLFVNTFDAYQHNLVITVILGILSKLLYLIIAMISARFFRPHKEMKEEPKMMLLFCSLPTFSMIIALVVAYLCLNADLSRSAGIMIIITFMALLTVNLLFFAIYNYIQKENKAFLELQISIQKDEADAAYYKALSTQTENQKILIHDINKHLNAICNLTSSDEVKAYVADIAKLTETDSKYNFCENPILNLIIRQYYQKCKSNGIDFNCDIRADVLSFMNSASITALFENLLSNAYEATLKSWEKNIDLTVVSDSNGGGIIITIENSCDMEPQADVDGSLRSSKKDNNLHGYGLKSIERVVKKYNGISTYRYDPDEKIFHYTIRFPNLIY